MNRLFCLAVAVLAAIGVSARGDDTATPKNDTAMPKGAPPRIVSVIRVDASSGLIEYREFLPQQFPFPAKDGPIKPGDPGEMPGPAYIPLSIKFSLKTGAVYDTAGSKIGPEVVTKRLAAGHTVLVSADYKPVDPAYLKVFVKDVLILVHEFPPPAGPLLKPGIKDK
jgi:hypothetical protein